MTKKKLNSSQTIGLIMIGKVNKYMKKGFPTKIFGMPYGWKDLGDVKKYVHDFCGKSSHAGKSKEELFLFCPTCLIKITRITKSGKKITRITL